MIPGAGRRRWSAHRFARGGGGGRLRAVRRLLALSLPSVDHCLLPLRRTRNQFIHVAGNLPPPGPLPLVRVTG